MCPFILNNPVLCIVHRVVDKLATVVSHLSRFQAERGHLAGATPVPLSARGLTRTEPLLYCNEMRIQTRQFCTQTARQHVICNDKCRRPSSLTRPGLTVLLGCPDVTSCSVPH